MASPLLMGVLLCSYYSIALGGNEGNFVVVPSSSFQQEAACPDPDSTVTSAEPSRASMPLAHIHSSCAPSGTSKEKPSFAERLRRSNARANYITGKVSGRTTTTVTDEAGSASIPTYLGGFVDSLEYVVTVGFGTPAVQQTVLIDTGSDLTWVQCQPCNSTACYPQKDPLFDPSKSSTYAAVPCSTQACDQLQTDDYGNGCTNSSGPSLCSFGIQYGGGETTTGVYSTETLTLKPGVAVKSFGFGCGTDQQGEFDLFDGLLGLGGAPESLVSQTASVYGAAFSYCLPPVNNSAGFLTLGAPGNSTAGFVFTPLHRFSSAPTFYVVVLSGISVAGKPLSIPPSVFSSGMIIDSGTVVTGLPTTAYKALRSSFRKAMAQYPLLPPSEDGLDTCYNFTGYSNVTVPKVALSFSGGATIDLDVPSGVLVEDCLAFADGGTDEGAGIIGNVNQRKFEVLYDSARGHVGFRAGAC